MRKISLLLTLLLIIIATTIHAQKPNGNGQQRGGKIIGRVIEAGSSVPIEYSNLVLLTENDSTQVTGTITNNDGEFSLTNIKPGNYILKASFIGFESTIINDISINRENRNIDLGEILLTSKAYELESAEVIANKSPVEYRIDKKVINVSEQSTTISGSAVEVLENVPSVSVDIEGNVSLRGSGSFTLLIDGRPTILDPSDALQQLPASVIENIEIVTNPSAKYESEGVSGIINVITKKNEFSGFSGVAHAHVGLDEKYGGDFTANYRTNGHSFNFGVDYNNRKYPGTGKENKITFNDEFKSFLNSTSSNVWGGDGFNLRGGADFTLSNSNLLGLSLAYGNRSHGGDSFVNFYEFTEPPTTESYYYNISKRERKGPRYSANLNYTHIFGQNQHEIKTELDFRESKGEETTTNEYYNADGNINSGRKNTEDGPSKRIRVKIDYSLPISNSGRIEAGALSEFRKSEDDTKSFILDANGGDYILEKDYSYLVDYDKNIHGIYSTYSDQVNKLGYQFGIRGEYTDRTVTLVDSNQTSVINRWDYFPTTHLSYKFNELVQVMASYTRRIRRPRGWYLEPFLTWMDANNVRRGNPELEPEYINSFEVAYQTHIDEVIFSLEGYYRERKNKIERVRAVYDTNVTITTMENVGTDYTLGAEFMVDADIFKFWNLNFLGDISQYKLEGTYDGNDYSRDNFNWSLRINNDFKLSESTKLQVYGRYQGPTISSQSEYEGYFSTNVALKQEFFEKKFSMTLQVRDIFSTSKREGTTSGPGFESYTHWQRKAPMVILNFTYNFNNFKQKKRGGNGDDMNGGDEF